MDFKYRKEKLKIKMQILWRITPEDKNKTEIIQFVQSFSKQTNVEFFTIIESLKGRLLRNLRVKTVAVVPTASEKDLIDLYFAQHLLIKALLVLLLPDTEPYTIAMGQVSLFPTDWKTHHG